VQDTANFSQIMTVSSDFQKGDEMNLMQKARTYVVKKWEPSTPPSTAVATKEQTALLPETEQPKEAEVVAGTFVPNIQITTGESEAHKHAARLRQTIESFNEEKQTPLEWLVVKFFTVLAYLLPILVAYVVGSAIGQAWAGKFDWSNPWSVYSYVISVGLEMMIPVMGYSVTVAVKRAAKDRTQIALPIVLSLLFLLLALGNSFAQMYLIEGHVKIAANDFKGQASLYFRSFGPLVIDTIATIFLSVVTVRNLRKFIRDMQAKEEGIHAVSRSEIAVQAAFDQAAIDRENARSEQERKRMDNELLRELTRRRNQDTLGNDSNGRGRYGGW
jgi:hypothetical protein